MRPSLFLRYSSFANSERHALKGQRAASPEPLDLWSLARQERPGYSGQQTFALKGQKHHPALPLLPFQGEPPHRRLPRALPWAGRSLPLRGVPCGVCETSSLVFSSETEYLRAESAKLRKNSVTRKRFWKINAIRPKIKAIKGKTRNFKLKEKAN